MTLPTLASPAIASGAKLSRSRIGVAAFGVFLPAICVLLDRFSSQNPLPEIARTEARVLPKVAGKARSVRKPYGLCHLVHGQIDYRQKGLRPLDPQLGAPDGETDAHDSAEVF
jgi:hypothetical protein